MLLDTLQTVALFLLGLCWFLVERKQRRLIGIVKKLAMKAIGINDALNDLAEIGNRESKMFGKEIEILRNRADHHEKEHEKKKGAKKAK